MGRWFAWGSGGRAVQRIRPASYSCVQLDCGLENKAAIAVIDFFDTDQEAASAVAARETFLVW